MYYKIYCYWKCYNLLLCFYWPTTSFKYHNLRTLFHRYLFIIILLRPAKPTLLRVTFCHPFRSSSTSKSLWGLHFIYFFIYLLIHLYPECLIFPALRRRTSLFWREAAPQELTVEDSTRIMILSLIIQLFMYSARLILD